MVIIKIKVIMKIINNDHHNQIMLSSIIISYYQSLSQSAIINLCFNKTLYKLLTHHIHDDDILWSVVHKRWRSATVYPKKYAHGFCFAVLCCGYTLTDFPISIRPTSLALWQSNDCPSASKATLMNMDKYFTWIHYERLHNHNKAKHTKTVCIFLGIYCISPITAMWRNGYFPNNYIW